PEGCVIFAGRLGVKLGRRFSQQLFEADVLSRRLAHNDDLLQVSAPFAGSTGTPKACVHLHHDMVVCCEHYAKGILAMTENDRCYSVAKLFFAYGLGNAGYYPLFAGATTILQPARPSPEKIFADIERYRPTLFFSVPTNYSALLAHHGPDGSEFELSSIRYGISAGEPLPAALFHRFRERFGVEILDALGSTEMLHMVISNRPGEIRPGSSGKIIPGFGARIVDDDDRD